VNCILAPFSAKQNKKNVLETLKITPEIVRHKFCFSDIFRKTFKVPSPCKLYYNNIIIYTRDMFSLFVY